MKDSATVDHVEISADEVLLEGDLVLPAQARGLVLFAHGSGSSRLSPRNRFVAGALQEAGLGTLLIDLLSRREELIDADTGHLRFNIEFLAERLERAADWLMNSPATGRLRLGLFGASTGAAAALVMASRRREVAAVVSRGGRPDLADAVLDLVQAPTLLIVGEHDEHVLELNEKALKRLAARPARLEIVPGATHLFPEPGALERVATLAREWFVQHL